VNGKFLEAAKLGKKLDDELVIDAHAHLGPWHNFFIPQNDIEGMMRVMDRVGMDVVCPAAHAGIGPDFVLGNDLVFEAMQKYPGRVAGYITLNPNYDDGVEKEVERCERRGMRHIKLHSIHGQPYTSKHYAPAFACAHDRGWVILLHTWGKSDRAVADLANRYGNAKFLMAHAGVVDFDFYVSIAKEHENVFLDLATSQCGYNWVETFVKEVGSDKVLFGSDMPFIAAQQQIGKVLCARISDDDKRKILGLNAKRIMEL